MEATTLRNLVQICYVMFVPLAVRLMMASQPRYSTLIIFCLDRQSVEKVSAVDVTDVNVGAAFSSAHAAFMRVPMRGGATERINGISDTNVNSDVRLESNVCIESPLAFLL